MALRSSWKGFIKLSLVSVPVRAFTAHNTSNEIRLNQLHSDCNNRIKYQKVCPEHGEVTNDDIVSGYEHAKGQYVVIDVDELDKLRTENDRSLNIQGFVEPNALDTVYYSGKTYYLAPDGPVGQKPYALLRQGMLEKGVEAIAKVVISKKEQADLLRVVEEFIVMTILNQEHLVKALDTFRDEVQDAEITPEELDLTKTLINASTLEKFDFSEYKDEYTAKLNELIEKKVAGQEVVQVPDPEKPKIVNLMDALKKSVAAAQGISEGEGAPADEEKPAAKKNPKSSKKKTKVG